MWWLQALGLSALSVVYCSRKCVHQAAVKGRRLDEGNPMAHGTVVPPILCQISERIAWISDHDFCQSLRNDENVSTDNEIVINTMKGAC